MVRFIVAIVTLSLGLVPSVSAEPSARQLFAAVDRASDQKPRPYGGHTLGCVAGAVELAETGPTWQAMRLSRNRNWGHPDTIDFLKRLSETAAAQDGWAGLYIGDIGLPRGGPVSGHRSHQSGMDVDIWMLPPKRLNLTASARESLSSISTRRANGAYVNTNWTRGHHEILKAAAKDRRVARIFVFPGAKVQMCKDARGNRAWLRKIRPWTGHHYHFHVRLKCPRGAKGCKDQAPPPRGDGCADAEQWVRDILDPPPPAPARPRDPYAVAPKRTGDLVLADLPAQCTDVLRSR